MQRPHDATAACKSAQRARAEDRWTSPSIRKRAPRRQHAWSTARTQGCTCGHGRMHFFILYSHGYVTAADVLLRSHGWCRSYPPSRRCIMRLSAACSRECMQPSSLSHVRRFRIRYQMNSSTLPSSAHAYGAPIATQCRRAVHACGRARRGTGYVGIRCVACVRPEQ